jgi:hypothetical protein
MFHHTKAQRSRSTLGKCEEEEVHAEALRRGGRGVFNGESKFPVFYTLPVVSLCDTVHQTIRVPDTVGATCFS